MTEEQILKLYSSPGLRKHELSRWAKKDWLSYAYPKMTKEEVTKLLDDIYGPEPNEQRLPDRTP
jgi:hypothetical protein